MTAQRKKVEAKKKSKRKQKHNTKQPKNVPRTSGTNTDEENKDKKKQRIPPIFIREKQKWTEVTRLI